MKLRMVDRILSIEPSRIRGCKAVSFEEYAAGEPLGRGDELPPTLALHALVELGNWLLMTSSGFTQGGLLASIERAAFDATAGPGDRLALEVRIADGQFSGSARLGDGAAACEATWTVEPVALETLHNPADLRVLLEEIRRPQEAAT